jgi:alpha-tubulin suppressor-like RCC1 family protein
VSAVNSVKGSALGFCLAVTQRRHIDDCGLEISGSLATDWMSIAQAFAGAPGVGREKGQFD